MGVYYLDHRALKVSAVNKSTYKEAYKKAIANAGEVPDQACSSEENGLILPCPNTNPRTFSLGGGSTRRLTR